MQFYNFAGDDNVMNKVVGKRGRDSIYPWATLQKRGDSFIIPAKGASDLDETQSRLCGAVKYRMKKNSGEKYITRRLNGNQVAVVRMHF